jgi:hypothetical protein
MFVMSTRGSDASNSFTSRSLYVKLYHVDAEIIWLLLPEDNPRSGVYIDFSMLIAPYKGGKKHRVARHVHS